MDKDDADDSCFLHAISMSQIEEIMIMDTLDEMELVSQEVQESQLKHDWSVHKTVHGFKKPEHEVSAHGVKVM